MNEDVISKVCIPWLNNPYIHPTTGHPVEPGSVEYKDLAQLCSDMINFDLLELIHDDIDHSITASPIVSFLSAAFISQYVGEKIHHPFQKAYHTRSGSLLSNFDFGFVWHTEEGEWTLVPPKGKNKLDMAHGKVQLVLISIIDNNEITVNLLFYDSQAHSWERFAPLGIRDYDDKLDRALMKYLEKYHTVIRGATSYYTPISCPISALELHDPRRQLYCSLWSLWFLIYRLTNSGQPRESQYHEAVGKALMKPEEFNRFVTDYISFIKLHKQRINGDDLVSQMFNLFTA
jgi:hypothetical protein